MVAAALLGVGVSKAPQAEAATLIWDSVSGTTGAQDGAGNWTAGGTTFWSGSANVATTNNTTTDIASFGVGGAGGVVNVSTQSIGGLIFDSVITTGYTLNSSTASQVLTLGASGIQMNSGALATTLGNNNLGITLGDAQTWTNNSTSTLTLGGTVSIAAGTSLTIDGTGNITLSGITGTTNSSTASNTGAIIKNGTGTLTFTTDPNNTGSLTINAGTVVFSPSSGNADFTVASVAAGATLRATSQNALSDSLVLTLNGTYDLRSNDTISRLNGSGTLTSGASGATLTVNNSSTNDTFGGVIQNGVAAIGFSKSGTNTVTLTGTNTATFGTLSINTGTLVVSGNAGSVSGSAGINIGDFNGGVDAMVVGANADVVATALQRLPDTGTISLRGYASLTINGPDVGSGGFVETVGTLNVNNGSGVLTLVPASGQELQLSGSQLTRTAEGTLLLRGPSLGAASGTANSTRLTFSSAPAMSGAAGADGSTTVGLVSWLVGDESTTGAGSGFVTYGPSSGMRLLTAQEYATAVSTSVLNENVTIAQAATLAADAIVNGLRFTGGSLSIGDAQSSLSINGAILATNAVTISGAGSLDFGTAPGLLTMASNTAATLTVDAPITGTGGVIAYSAGTAQNIVQLGGDNSFIGIVRVRPNTVLALKQNAPGALNQRVANDLALDTGAVLRLNGNSVSVGNLTTNANSRTAIIENGVTGVAWLTTFTTANQTWEGVLQNGSAGSLAFIKSGGGVLTIQNANSTHTGVTEVRGGGLSLNSNSAGRLANTSSVILVTGGAVTLGHGSSNSADRINNSATLVLRGGSLTQNGSGTNNQSESIGQLIVQNGLNTITSGQAGSSNTQNLTFASLATRTGGVVNFAGTDQGLNNRNRLVFTTAPSLNDGVIGGWAVAGNEFVKYVTAGTVSVTPLVAGDYFTTGGADPAWTTSTNAKPATSVTFSGSGGFTVNTLNLADAIGVDLGGRALTLDAGGLIKAGTTGIISNGSLTSASGDLALKIDAGTQDFATNAVAISGAISLTRYGAGALTLGNANTFSGYTALLQGTTTIGADASLGTPPLVATAAHLRLYGGTLAVSQTMTLDANRGIETGQAGAVVSITAGTSGNGRTLTYNGAITSVGEGGITFQSNATTTNVEPGRIVAALTAPIVLGGAFRVEAGTISVPSGASVVGRSFQLGMNGQASYTQTGGTLRIGAGIAGDVFDVGVSGSNSINKSGTLDLTGVSQLTAAVETVRWGVVAGGDTSAANSTVTLATNNSITALTSMTVGDSANAGLATQTVAFGSGFNSIISPSVVLGGRKAVFSSTLASGATLSISGFRQRSAALSIARQNVVTSGLNISDLNATAGTFFANLDSLTIGLKSTASGNVGGADGTLSFGGTSNVETNTLTLGDMSGASGTAAAITRAFGTINMSGGTMNVLGNVTLGTYAGTLGTARGLISLTGGTFIVGGNITKTANDRSGAVVIIDGGTLDLRDEARGDADNGTMALSQLVVRSGSLVDAGQITLDGRGVTDGVTFAALDAALILRDINLSQNLVFSNGTALKGGVLYESAGAGQGGVLSGVLDLGGFQRPFVVEDGPGSADLTVSASVSSSGGIVKSGAGTLLWSSPGATYSGSTAVQNGRMILAGGAADRLGAAGGLTLGAGSASGVLQLGDSSGPSSQTVSSLASSGTGLTNAIVGGSASLSVLTVSQSAATTYAGNIGGTGLNENNLSLVKGGAGALTLSGANLSFAGGLSVNAGTLNLTGSPVSAIAPASITVAGGATFSLLNGAGQAITLGAGALSLGQGAGVTTLGLELGSTVNFDRITSSSSVQAANSIVLNLAGIAGFAAGQYDLITAAGGLDSAAYSIGALSGALTGVSLSLTSDPTFVRLSVTAASGDHYWDGSVGTSWIGLGAGNSTNWTSDSAGDVGLGSTPGANSGVIFSSDDVTGSSLVTTLDGVFTIRDLTFNNAGSLTSVVINPGNGGSLTITPTDAAKGVVLPEGVLTSVTLASPIVLGADQTWSVGTGGTLSSSGGISGSFALTKAGSGVLALTGSNTYGGATFVNAGVLRAGVANAFSPNSALSVGANGILRLNGFANAIGSLSGTAGAIVENGAASGNVILTVGADNSTTTFAGVLQNGAAANLGLTKVGNGRLTLSGSNTLTGAITVNAGRLELTTGTSTTGAFTVGGGAATRGMLQIGAGANLTTADMDFGGNATGAGAGYQSGGSVTLTTADGNGLFGIGNVANSFGYYEVSGGSITANRLSIINTGQANPVGIFRQTGGTVTVNTWTLVGHGQGSAMLDIAGGTFNGSTNFAMSSEAGSYALFNVRGTGVVAAKAGSSILLSRGDSAARDNTTNIFSLLTGGTVRVASGGITNGTASGATNNLVFVGLDGGKLVTDQATTSLINLNQANSTLAATSGAYVFAGGLTVDTNGFNSAIPTALQAPAGRGVASVAVASAGSGYLSAPFVRLTGGTGVGASAIANMEDDGTGRGTFRIASITITNPGQGYAEGDTLTASFNDNAGLYLSQAVLGAVALNSGNVSGGLTKTGRGALTLSGANTYAGVTTISNGVLSFASTSASPANGTVNVQAGGYLALGVGGAGFYGTGDVDSLFAGTFAGVTNAVGSGVGIDTAAGNASYTLPSSPLNFAKVGANTLTLTVPSAYAGTIALYGGTTLLAGSGALGAGGYSLEGGNLTLNWDGTSATAASAPETLSVANAITMRVPTATITVGRAAAAFAPYGLTAANKTIELAGFELVTPSSGITLTVANGNEFGLLIPADLVLPAAGGTSTFSVGTASSSLQADGLRLSGQITGGLLGSANVVLTKSGAGTLFLGAENSFGGGGSIIDITDGVLAVTSDAALGDSDNLVRLSANSLTEGFRAADTFTSARVFRLNAASSGIDVSKGEMLTLTTAFGLSAVNNALQKNDIGTLVINADNATWTGAVTINQGVLRVGNSGALGTSAAGVTINFSGGLEISGGVTVSDAISFNAGNNNTLRGIDGLGAIRAVDGQNVLAGKVTIATSTGNGQNRSGVISAAAGAQLTITGGIEGGVGTVSTEARHSGIGFGGAGTINITTTGLTHTNQFGIYQLTKVGNGVLNLQVAGAFSGRDVYVSQGTLSVNGAGNFGTAGSGQGTRRIYINDQGTFVLDNVTGAAASNRLGVSDLYYRGGEFLILGGAGATTTETTTGVLNVDGGKTILTLDADPSQQLNFTHGAVTRGGSSSLLIRGDGFGSAAGAGVATVRSSTNFAFTGQTGATDTTNKSIIPWILGDTSLTGLGMGFVTADSTAGAANTGTNILRLLRASEQVTSFEATRNVSLSGVQDYEAGALLLANPLSVNSLRLNSGGGVAMIGGVALTLESGGLLAFAGNTGFSSPSALLTTASNREFMVHALGDLTLAGPLVGTTGGLNKSGAGQLTLGSAVNTFTGTVAVQEGALWLAGGDFTVLPNQTLNLLGGSVDLRGATHHFNNLQAQAAGLAVNDFYAAGYGGDIVNSAAGKATLALTTGNVSFSGRIRGLTDVVRSQAANSFQDWNFSSDNDFAGMLLLNGGRTQVIDEARLSGVSSVELASASLLFTGSNTSYQPVSSSVNRLRDQAPITLRGGLLQFRAYAGNIYAENIGPVTLGAGASILDVDNPGTSINQYDVTAASLVRESGSRATLRFLNIDGTLATPARLFFSTAPTLTNRIIGGWAVFEREFASYSAGMGVGALNTAGFAGYDAAALDAATAGDNVRIATTGTTALTGDRSANTLAIVVAGATTLDLGGSTLRLAAGGLIAANSADSTSISITNGSITAGAPDVGGDFYLHALSYNSGNDIVDRDVNVSARFVDNGSGPLTLVINGTDGRGTGQGSSSTNLTGLSTHSGGTFVNAGRLFLNAAGADGTSATALGTGNLTVTGGFSTNGNNVTEVTSVVQLATAGQIANAATVTLNGGAILDLAGNTQTVGGLVFNNTGGFGPSVSFAGGTLVLGGDVSASGSNLGAVATLGGTIRSGRSIANTPDLRVSSTAGLSVGMTVSGGNVPGGLTISAITNENNLVLSGNNGGTTTNSMITFGSLGTVSLGGATRTFAIDDVKLGSQVLHPYLAQLNVTAPVVGVGSEGITKTGNGLLQLSSQSTFSGGVNVSAGGLIIGGSTNVTVRDSLTGEAAAFASGPVGTGLLTLSSGARLLSSGANTLNNAYSVGSSLTYSGVQPLTLNGATTLAGNITVNVEEPLTTLTLNGAIGEAAEGFSITKQGLGTLLLGGNNAFTGGVTVNAGTLALAGLNAGSTAPIYAGTTATIAGNGMLALLNSGTGSNGIVAFAGKIAVATGLDFANISVGNNGANAGNTIQVDELLLVGGQTLNVSSANSYILRILNLTGDEVDGIAPKFNVAAGTTAVVFDYDGDRPVNVGLGSLVFPDLVYSASATTLSGGAIALNGSYPMSVQHSVIPLNTTMSTFGHRQGGLSGAVTMLSAAPTAVVQAANSGLGYSASGQAVGNLSDGAYGGRPVVVPGTAVNTVGTYSGLLRITTAGNYVFRSGTDDGGTLFIGGAAVLTDATYGHAFTDIPSVTVPLQPGYHHISYKFGNSGAGGGFRLLYAGEDTGNAFQVAGGDNFLYADGVPAASNGYNGAAVVMNDYGVADSTVASIDTFGSVFGVLIDASKSLTIGANAVLNIHNGTNGSHGNGFFGSAGPVSVGPGAILAPGNTATAAAGSLNLIGAVTQSGSTLVSGVGATTAMIKAGQGALFLGADNSATFSGLLVVQGGTVVLNHAKALSTGTVGTLISHNGNASTFTGNTTLGSATISSVSSVAALQPGMSVTGTGIPAGAYVVSVLSANSFTISQPATAAGSAVALTPLTSGMLDLNGMSGVTGNVTINGAGPRQLNAVASGALWNSSATAASLSGKLTLGSSATVGGYGDLTLGVIEAAVGSTLTKSGSNTLFLDTDNGAGLQGPLAISAGMVKLGNAGALGASTSMATDGTTVASGAVLDLNGLTLSEFLTVSGVGLANFGAGANSLATLINTSSTTATLSSPLVLAAAAAVGSGRVNATSGVPAGGDITLSGAISGAFLLSKVGANTLTLSGANTQNGLTVTQGVVVVNGAAGAAGAGGNLTVDRGVFSGLTPGNQLIFDNSADAFSSRAGGAASNRSILLQGGGFVLRGNATTAVSENLGTGGLQINFGFNVLTLESLGAAVQLAGTGTIVRAGSSTLNGVALLRGTRLGLNAAGDAGALSGDGNSSLAFAAPAFSGSTATSGAAMRMVPWLIIDPSAAGDGTGAGVQFATFDATAGIGFRPLLAASENLTTFTAGNNVRAVAALSAAAGAASALTPVSVNSLTFEAGGSLAIPAFRVVTNASGGILAKASAAVTAEGAGIGRGAIYGNGNAEAIITVFGGANVLTIDAAIGGALAPSTGGLTKSGNGALVLANATGNSYTGTTTVQLGSLQFASTAPDNAIFYRFLTGPGLAANATTHALNPIVVNAGMLDLNGRSQSAYFFSRGILPGSGGVITNTAAGNAVDLTHVIDANDRDFAGSFSGNLNLRLTGTNRTTLRADNQLTGNVTVMGGIVALQDQGRFSGLGSGDVVSVRNSILRWDDTGIQALAGRIPTTASLVLDGGTFEFIGRGAASSTISLGDLSLAGGTSTLRGSAGTGGFGLATLALTGSFTRSVGATLNFTSAAGLVGGGPYFTATAAGLTTRTNGILGGWATVHTLNGTTGGSDVEFATYDPVVAIRPLNNVEQTATFAASGAASNLRFSGIQTVPAGGFTVNSVTMNASTASTLAFASGGDTLILASGGLLGGTADVARAVGSSAVRGRLSSGGPELFVHNARNTLTIFSEITGTLSPVFTSAGQTGGAAITLANANSYVGTTYVNGVILNLGVAGATSAGNAITGDLIVTGGTTNGSAVASSLNAAVTLQASGQIADGATLTVRGGARFQGAGFDETIANLVLRSHGGYSADGGPLVTTGAGRLTVTGGITVEGLEDLRSIPVIQGNLGLSAASAIAVGRFVGASVRGTLGHVNEQVGLVLNAHVNGVSELSKTGAGAMQLGGTSTSVTVLEVV